MEREAFDLRGVNLINAWNRVSRDDLHHMVMGRRTFLALFIETKDEQLKLDPEAPKNHFIKSSRHE